MLHLRAPLRAPLRSPFRTPLRIPSARASAPRRYTTMLASPMERVNVFVKGLRKGLRKVVRKEKIEMIRGSPKRRFALKGGIYNEHNTFHKLQTRL